VDYINRQRLQQQKRAEKGLAQFLYKVLGKYIKADLMLPMEC